MEESWTTSDAPWEATPYSKRSSSSGCWWATHHSAGGRSTCRGGWEMWTSAPGCRGLTWPLASLVSSRDAAVFDARGAGIPANESLRRPHEYYNDPYDPYFAAIRWAVVLGDNARVVAQIQGLPGPAAVLYGKPAVKRTKSSQFAFHWPILHTKSLKSSTVSSNVRFVSLTWVLEYQTKYGKILLIVSYAKDSLVKTTVVYSNRAV